jgi:hypothetical protein
MNPEFPKQSKGRALYTRVSVSASRLRATALAEGAAIPACLTSPRRLTEDAGTAGPRLGASTKLLVEI